MSIFMVYVIFKNLFLFINCIKSWFELVNQKTFEMKFFKMAHITFLVTFHNLKMIVYQNFNLPYIYGHHLKKIHLWYVNYQIFHMVH